MSPDTSYSSADRIDARDDTTTSGSSSQPSLQTSYPDHQLFVRYSMEAR